MQTQGTAEPLPKSKWALFNAPTVLFDAGAEAAPDHDQFDGDRTVVQVERAGRRSVTELLPWPRLSIPAAVAGLRVAPQGPLRDRMRFLIDLLQSGR